VFPFPFPSLFKSSSHSNGNPILMGIPLRVHAHLYSKSVSRRHSTVPMCRLPQTAHRHSRTLSPGYLERHIFAGIIYETRIVERGHPAWSWLYVNRYIFCVDMRQNEACVGGAVGSVAVRTARLRWSANLGSRPNLAESLCQVIAAYALRLNSRAGTEG